MPTKPADDSKVSTSNWS